MIENIYILKINFKLLSGLFIGGNDSGFDIGGADMSVIKNPLTKEPYIPGSSLKGKLKSLLKYNKETKIEKGTLDFKNTNIKNIFEPVDDKEVKISRAIFRNMYLTDESKLHLESILGKKVYTEIKAENSINAIKGTAESPRFIERVPAGAEFCGEIVLNVFDEDDAKFMMDIIKESLRLLEYNYLGGSGTRGYGRVKVAFDDFVKVGD